MRLSCMKSIPAAAEERPVRFCPPEAFAAGAALAFYSVAPAFLLLAAATAICAFALAMRTTLAWTSPKDAVPDARNRARLGLLAAFGAGLAAGAGALLSESACSLPIPEPGTGGAAFSGVSGVMLSDTQPTSGGGSLLPLSVREIELRFPASTGTVSWPLARPRLTIYAAARLEADSGAGIRGFGMRRFGDAGLASAARVAVTPPPGLTAGFRGRAKRAAVDAVEAVSGKSAGLLKALLLGVRDDLDSSESAAFRNAGCAHILSLSGQHLSILGVLVMTLAGRFLGKRRAGAVSMGFVCGFVWLAGPAPALVRSLAMVVLAFLARVLDRPQRMSNILALSFALGLLSDSPSARTLSFTLSHLAMAGLVMLAPRCSYLLGRLLPPFLESPVSAGLASVLCTAPVSIAAFGSLAPIGIAASAISGPLVAALMWWVILAAILAAVIPAAAPFCVPVTGFLHSALSFVMGTAARVPGLPLPAGPPADAARCVVVAFALCVYARPYADHLRNSGPERGIRKEPRSRSESRPPPRLRFARKSQSPPGD